MEQIVVKSQQELDAIPTDYNGRIVIEFGTPYNRAVVNRKFKYSVVARGSASVVAWDSASVVAWDSASVEAWDSASVVARGSASVEAWDSASVVAWDSASVVARDSASVEAWDSASVVARGSASVVARDSASVVAWDSASVVAKHNSQVNDKTQTHKVSVSGNARVVYDPQNINEYIDTYELENDGKTVRLFKAVHKRNGKYMADWTPFEYIIGEVAEADSLDEDVNEDCGHGIHMAYKEWCVSYGANWPDLAILELEAEIDGVIVPLGGPGKVRAAKAKVIREVPLEECGLYGKMLARRMK